MIYDSLFKGLLLDDRAIIAGALSLYDKAMETDEFRKLAEQYPASVCGTLKIVVEAFREERTLSIIKLDGDTDSNGAFYCALYYAPRPFPADYSRQIWKFKKITAIIGGNS